MQDLQYLIAHKKPHRLIDGVIPIIYSSVYIASNTNCYKKLKINKLQSKKSTNSMCEKAAPLNLRHSASKAPMASKWHQKASNV